MVKVHNYLKQTDGSVICSWCKACSTSSTEGCRDRGDDPAPKRTKSVVEAVQTAPKQSDQNLLNLELYELRGRIAATQAALAAVQAREMASYETVLALRARVKAIAEAGPRSVCRSFINLELRYARKCWRDAAVEASKEWFMLLGDEPLTPNDAAMVKFLSDLPFVKENQRMIAVLPNQTSELAKKLVLDAEEYLAMRCFIQLQQRPQTATIDEFSCKLLGQWLPDADLETKSADAGLEIDLAALRDGFQSLYAVSEIINVWFEDLMLIIPLPKNPLELAHYFAMATLAKRAKVPYKFERQARAR